MLRLIKRLIPRKLFQFAQPVYHWKLALLGALLYRFPSRHIKVIAITGTKGKSTTVELVNAILEAAGKKTAVAGTIRFKIGNETRPNLFKMTMPGRFFIQKFLREAVEAKCDYAVIEMTSEGAKQFRHKFIDLNALIFLNLTPEHIESHGSYEKYRDAKLSLAHALAESPKKNKVMVVNGDDPEAPKFIEAAKGSIHKIFSIKDAGDLKLRPEGLTLQLQGKTITSHLRGRFNAYNILSAATFALAYGISIDAIRDGIQTLKEVRGRVEGIKVLPNQPFEVIVDYAHTPDSLTKLYEAFPNNKKICVLGNTGGGRDAWKRPVMASIAEKFCDTVILTNEDPYDEDPRKIVDDMEAGMKNKKPLIIMDRGEAIHTAIKKASAGDVILISGKGTDPCIMGPNGTKIPWDDATVVREELKKMFDKKPNED